MKLPYQTLKTGLQYGSQQTTMDKESSSDKRKIRKPFFSRFTDFFWWMIRGSNAILSDFPNRSKC